MTAAIILLILAIPIGLVVLLVVMLGRRGASTRTGAASVRQFFQYAILYGLVLVTALGVEELLVQLVEPASQQSGPNTELARALAFTLVGAPLAAILAAVSRKQQRADPGERQSAVWALHVTAGAVTGLIGSMVAFHGLLTAGLGVGNFHASDVVLLAVWGSLWVAYWLIDRRALTPVYSQPHILLGSLIGLVVAVYGLVAVLTTTVNALIPSGLALGSGHGIVRAVSLFATGAIVWIWYWVLHGLKSRRGILWHVLVLPLGVGGGLLMAVIGASVMLWRLLVWFVGNPLAETAAGHFRGTTVAAATAAVGLLVWWYHRSVLGVTRERTEVHRVHEYLVAAVGLGAAAYGVGTLIVAGIETITPGIDLGLSAVDTLLAALTLLAVGTPLWWIHWSRAERAAAADPAGELVSPTRRTYIVILFGLAGLAAVIALVTVSYMLLVDIIDAAVSGGTFREMRYGLGVLAAAAAVSVYHWAVQRADRAALAGVVPPAPVHAEPGTPPSPDASARLVPHRASVVLIGSRDEELSRRLEQETDSAVETWPTAQPSPPWIHDDVLAAVRAHPGVDLTIVAGPGGLTVIEVTRPGHQNPEPTD